MEWVNLMLAVVIVVFAINKFFPKKIVDVSKLGSWVVVTGATDGIGKAFAHELAKKRFNVVLVSRNLEKLDAVAGEIRRNYGVSTKVIEADFTKTDESMYSRIEKELGDLEIGVLVNNVGTTHHPQYFLDVGEHHGNMLQYVINCNIMSMVHMTKIVMRGMVDRRKGLVVNVSSGLSEFPSPSVAMYGATKSFVNKFSQNLDIEYRGSGVHVHVLTTGWVATKLSGVKPSGWLIPSPETYVRSALEEISRKRICTGYIGHTALSWVAKLTFLVAPSNSLNRVLHYAERATKKYNKLCKKCNPPASH